MNPSTMVKIFINSLTALDAVLSRQADIVPYLRTDLVKFLEESYPYNVSDGGYSRLHFRTELDDGPRGFRKELFLGPVSIEPAVTIWATHPAVPPLRAAIEEIVAEMMGKIAMWKAVQRELRRQDERIRASR
jgi:hypothetical protein